MVKEKLAAGSKSKQPVPKFTSSHFNAGATIHENCDKACCGKIQQVTNGKSEDDYSGNINTVGNQSQCKEVEITVDSGAYNNVCGEELLPEIERKGTEASRRREYFFTASKEKSPQSK